MKLQLTQPGYESYTGLLGNLQFVNGVSVDEVSAETAAGIANILRVELISGVTDQGQADDTDPTEQVDDTTGNPDAATDPAPVDAE